jgi:hypothetical protein
MNSGLRNAATPVAAAGDGGALTQDIRNDRGDHAEAESDRQRVPAGDAAPGDDPAEADDECREDVTGLHRRAVTAS